MSQLRFLRSRRFMFLCAGFAMLSFVFFPYSGCKKSEPSPTSPGNTDEIIPVSDDRRFQIFDSLTTSFNKLTDADPGRRNLQFQAILSSIPEVRHVYITDEGCVSAIFTDGRVLVVTNNRPVLPAQPQPIVKSILSRRTIDDVPADRRARVINVLGSFFSDNVTFIKKALLKNGYQISGTDGTIDGLKVVNGDGVFYIDSHGGTGGGFFKDGKFDSTIQSYSIMTATPTTRLNDFKYKTDLDNQLLRYMMAEKDTFPDGTKLYDLNYGITPKFVHAYMSFGTNSIVFINACESADASFREECKTANASAYVGWDKAVDDGVASVVAKLIFARMLGDQTFSPPDPPQRPFSLTLIDDYLREQFPQGFPDPANLKYKTRLVVVGPKVFTAQLAPSIRRMTVDETKSLLTIKGEFGHKPDSVLINESSINIISGDSAKVVCSIPKTGANASGDVIVVVDGHRSNAVQLTEWTGNVIFDYPYVDSLLSTFTFTIHFRADVHSYRLKPGKPPVRPPLDSTIALSDSKASFTTGGAGEVTCYDSVIECYTKSKQVWTSKTTQVPFVSRPDLIAFASGFYAEMHYAMQTKSLTMRIVALTSGDALQSTETDSGRCPAGSNVWLDLGSVQSNYGGTTGTLVDVDMTFDDNYNIVTNSLAKTSGYQASDFGGCVNPEDLFPFNIHWATISPVHPPKPDAARGISP